MHVLIVPSERIVPPENPVAGIFQYHQAVALCRAGIKVGILAPAPRSGRDFLGRFRVRPAKSPSDSFPFPTVINHRPSLCPGRFTGIMQSVWNRIGRRMFRDYVCRHGRPDLIHAHCVRFAGVCCQRIAVAESIPYIITEHSSAFVTGAISRSESIAASYRGAGARIMVSPFLGTKVEAVVGSAATPWTYVPNILDPRFEELVSLYAPQSDETFRFLCVAQFVPIKNHIALIRAFASSFYGRKNVELLLGGSGPLLEQARITAAECGISGQVRFLGFLTREQVITQMLKCNALVLPSLMETFGVVLIEAMACGKPVVSPSGSGPDVIVNKDNGILFRTGDCCDLANALTRMFEIAGRFDPIAIRNDCVGRFGQAAVVARLITVYEGVLNSHKEKDYAA